VGGTNVMHNAVPEAEGLHGGVDDTAKCMHGGRVELNW
jgi:hypothetical protein